MKHFYSGIDGWFDFSDIYSGQVKRVTDKATFVEVGAWKGKSASYMAVEILNSKKDIDFHVVDTFQGADTETQQSQIRAGLNLYEVFKYNLRPVIDEKFLHVHVKESLEAAKMFDDHSLDFVFIDANHLYEYVKADIKAWMPKVKQGGVLAGHDWYGHPQVQRAVIETVPKFKVIKRSWLSNL